MGSCVCLQYDLIGGYPPSECVLPLINVAFIASSDLTCTLPHPQPHTLQYGWSPYNYIFLRTSVPVNMPLCASRGPVLAHNGMFMGLQRFQVGSVDSVKTYFTNCFNSSIPSTGSAVYYLRFLNIHNSHFSTTAFSNNNAKKGRFSFLKII